jgi:hypothetical protein
MIDGLALWLEANLARLISLGINPSLTRSPIDRPKRSAWLDLDTAEIVCRIIVWESGECDLEMINVPSGRPEIEHLELESPARLPDLLEKAVTRLVQDRRGKA